MPPFIVSEGENPQFSPLHSLLKLSGPCVHPRFPHLPLPSSPSCSSSEHFTSPSSTPRPPRARSSANRLDRLIPSIAPAAAASNSPLPPSPRHKRQWGREAPRCRERHLSIPLPATARPPPGKPPRVRSNHVPISIEVGARSRCHPLREVERCRPSNFPPPAHSRKSGVGRRLWRAASARGARFRRPSDQPRLQHRPAHRHPPGLRSSSSGPAPSCPCPSVSGQSLFRKPLKTIDL